jgi:hypothetical protein
MALPCCIFWLGSTGQTRCRIKWPKSSAASAKQEAFNRGMVADWLGTLPAAVTTLSTSEAALHTIPALVGALSPPADALDGLLLGNEAAASMAATLVDKLGTYAVTYDMGSGLHGTLGAAGDETSTANTGVFSGAPHAFPALH